MKPISFRLLDSELTRSKSVQFSTTLKRMMEFDHQDIVDFIKTSYNPPAPHTLWDEIKRALSIFAAARGKRALLLNASSGKFHPDVMAIILIRLIPRKKRPLIALAGAMWQPNQNLRGFLDRILIKTADKVIGCYVVQSTEEMESFPRYWNIDARKVRLCPYFSSLTGEEVDRPSIIDEYIFAGGNSHRNYQPLVEVARLMPDCKFVIASYLLDGRSDLPPNIKTGNVSHKKFVDLMKSSSIVVVPMDSGLLRAGGQQTYLNAMLLGKPVVVSDGFGVKDHVQDKKTGLIVSGSTDSYFQALSWLLDPANKDRVNEMKYAAQTDVRENFSMEKHVSKLMEIMKDFIAEENANPSQ